jgi:uncharacterized protein YabN with tetrapyrrole methylase and pyrophosphatase domain
MTTHIQMFNVDTYDTWDMAENLGAVYTVVVHSVDEPDHGAGKYIMDDILHAINETANMLAGSPHIRTRIRNYK